MTSTKKLFNLTQLAEASYADLILGKSLVDELQNSSFGMSFSATQATEFATHWSVASHQENTGSGFSATLFEDKTASGNYTLAIRGTEMPSGIFSDLLSADVNGITLTGAAFSQIVDLYNYWQRLTTAATAHYTQAKLVTTTSPPANGYIYSYQMRDMLYFVSINHTTSTDFGLGKLSPTAKVDVTGHSLGGHLATAFARLFPDNTADILTVNGAGFGGDLLDPFFNQLAGHTTTFAKATENSNLFGEKGPEIITSDVIFNQYGERGAVQIEQGGLAGHSSSQMTDSLAVANLFIKLDASFSNKTPAQALSTLNALFEKSSNQATQSLEKLVIGLSQTILGTKPTIVTDDREALYSTIKTLTDSVTYKALIGKATLITTPVSAREARTDLGAFLSLFYLTPFALKVEDAGALNLLYAVHQSLADKWNDDRNLTAEQIANGEANFSDMYLADRAAMLSWKLKLNEKDIQTDSLHPYENQNPLGLTDTSPQYFQDITSQTELYLGGADRRKFIFGSISNDTPTGGDLNDHLYGMGGDDTLSGGAGNDWLEGGANDDNLNGDSGNDQLFGGVGNDILDGGESNDKLYGNNGLDTLDGGQGNDYLYGGAGYDIYNFKGDFGTDIVSDSDGDGQIIINGQVLSNATFKFENIYKDDTSGYTFTKLNGDKSIVISKTDGSNHIIINDWSELKSLGLTFTGEAPSAPAATLAGDFKKKIDDHGTASTGDDTYIMTDGNYTADENAPDGEENAPDLITGTNAVAGIGGKDVIFGLGGDDALSGGSGDDYIDGGLGNDVIQGGLGKDALIGGDGDDKIYGSSDYSIIKPVDINFTRPVNGYPHPQSTGFNWTSGYRDTYSNGAPYAYGDYQRNRLDDDQGNMIEGGAGAAGTGADYVHGGTDNDVIWGMDKDDILFGDDGNDVVYGDGDKPSSDSVVWTAAANQGNDTIDGGDGNDMLFGQGKDDVIFGGKGNDKIWGDDQTETKLSPDAHGNDTLLGGTGIDTLMAGADDDLILGYGNVTGAANDNEWRMKAWAV